jgi:hypothetical protein
VKKAHACVSINCGRNVKTVARVLWMTMVRILISVWSSGAGYIYTCTGLWLWHNKFISFMSADPASNDSSKRLKRIIVLELILNWKRSEERAMKAEEEDCTRWNALSFRPQYSNWKSKENTELVIPYDISGTESVNKKCGLKWSCMLFSLSPSSCAQIIITPSNHTN